MGRLRVRRGSPLRAPQEEHSATSVQVLARPDPPLRRTL